MRNCASKPTAFTAKVTYGWLIAFVAFGVLYALTANRGAQWQDSGYHILRALTGEVRNPLGLALSHPLHHWLARLALWLDFTEPCHAVTLVSSFAAAVAVANVFGCVATLTRSWIAAAFASASFGLAHTVWQVATLAETYTLVAALLSAECWCLLIFLRSRQSRFLCAALLLNGLGLSNHLLAGLSTPVLVAIVVWCVSRRHVHLRGAVAAGAFWLLGAALYGQMVLIEWLRSGDARGTLHSAFFGVQYIDEVFNVSVSTRLLAVCLGFIILSFPNLLLPSAVNGAIYWPTEGTGRILRRVLLIDLAIYAVFVLRYNVPDQQFFFAPMYVYAAILGGVGFAEYVRSHPARRRAFVGVGFALLALTPLLYAATPDLIRRSRLLSARERHKPYRDDYVYLFTPWSIAERSAQRLSREAAELAGDNGVIIVQDLMAEFAVRYQVLRRGAQGVQIAGSAAPPAIEAALREGRPVVLVPASTAAPPPPQDEKDWKRVGDLYVLPH